jgi:pentapeptide repeat protein
MSDEKVVPLSLSGGKYFRRDFSGMDLKGVEMHHSQFTICNFRDADISGNDCSHSNFSGSDFTNIRCNMTNFAHSVLNCKFFPKDAFGITVTLECKNFRGMTVSKLWWQAWVYFALLMIPEKDKGVELTDLLLQALGKDRYIRLKQIFDVRQL